MNGTFLLALGAAWAEVRLPQRAEKVAFWDCALRHVRQLAGNHAGRSFRHRSPVSDYREGHTGLGWQERLVTIGFITVGLTIVASSVLVLWGLRAAKR